MISPYVFPILSTQPQLLKNIHFLDVAEVVAKHYGLTVNELKMKIRDRHIVIPRQMAQTLMCRTMAEVTIQKIAAFFNCHHATVIYSRQIIDNLRIYDDSIKTDYEALYKKLIARNN